MSLIVFPLTIVAFEMDVLQQRRQQQQQQRRCKQGVAHEQADSQGSPAPCSKQLLATKAAGNNGWHINPLAEVSGQSYMASLGSGFGYGHSELCPFTEAAHVERGPSEAHLDRGVDLDLAVGQVIRQSSCHHHWPNAVRGHIADMPAGGNGSSSSNRLACSTGGGQDVPPAAVVHVTRTHSPSAHAAAHMANEQRLHRVQQHVIHHHHPHHLEGPYSVHSISSSSNSSGGFWDHPPPSPRRMRQPAGKGRLSKSRDGEGEWSAAADADTEYMMPMMPGVESTLLRTLGKVGQGRVR